ncbi:hypothetical protein CTRI78_v004189 [Colletotrichum trifolii]|uniref:Uncharacterized protein n=1 Tax=Colletotrichum trifolii TaxID=5466 RepID=A0A4R8RL36_COLTR|nr:hypothetical protein CTRI78_v004189 [Colletotrichum trifolii]
MRRYNSTKSTSGLSRTKSTKSTASFRTALQQLEHIDPATADRDAHIAASLSFSRASKPAGTGPRPSLPTQGSCKVDFPLEPSTGSEKKMDNLSKRQGLRRHGSVRFVEPAQEHDIPLIRRRTVLGSSNYCQTRSESRTDGPYVSPLTTSYIESLPPAESYRPANECASVPSSYGKVRRSKSMFNPAKKPLGSKYYFNDSPEQTSPKPAMRHLSVQDTEEESPAVQRKELRAPQSTSFLRIRDKVLNTRHENDLAVKNAENKLRRDVEKHSRLKSRPSAFFMPKQHQSRGSLRFRKSMRDVTNASRFDQSTISLPALMKKDGSLRKRARKVSTGIRTKLKSLFQRSKDPLVFHKQVPERGPQSPSGEPEDSEQEDLYMDIIDTIPTEECSVSQVPSRVPSLHAASSSQKLRSRQGSLESIDSDKNGSEEKSRVTSWTSSGTHTLISQGTWAGEKDRQRLSVIKENGLHFSSSSFQRPAYRDPITYDFEPVQHKAVPRVDSQKVYSALMSRLKESREPGGQKENVPQVSVEDFASLAPSRLPSSKDDVSESSSVRTSPTIRCVLPEDDVFQDAPLQEISNSNTHAIDFSNAESTSSTGSVLHHRKRSTIGAPISYGPFPAPAIRHDITVSQQKRANNRSGEIPPTSKALSTRSSAFFGSPTCHLFRTTSPYRRAIQASMKDTSGQSTETSLSRIPSVNLDLITRRRPSLTSEDPRVAYSESIYSDQPTSPKGPPQALTPGGQNSRNGQSARWQITETKIRMPMLRFENGRSNDNEGHGSDISHGTTELPDTTPTPLTYTPTLPTDRKASFASSLEWKTFLSANVSKADVTARGNKLSEVRYAKPSMPRESGHVREQAQIEDDSPITYKPTGSVKKTRTPVRPAVLNHRQTLSASGAESIQSRYSTPVNDENAVPNSEGRSSSRTHAKHGPPPIPPRNSLRTMPSLPMLHLRRTQSNIPVKSPERLGAKNRSMDSTPEHKLNQGSPRVKLRSPIKLVRRADGRSGLKSSSSSPGFTSALERKFGSQLSNEQTYLGSPRSKRRCSNRPLLDASESTIIDDSDTGGSDEWRAQKSGSQKMVENFLSSRRGVLAGSAFL